MTKYIIAVAALVASLLALPAAAAPVGFTGAYDYATWTTSTSGGGIGGSAAISGDKQTLTLYEPDSGGGSNGFNFTHAVVATGTLSFDWAFNGFNDACCSGFNVYVNDTLFNLANDSFAPGYVYDGPSLFGSFSMVLNAGDIFSFQQFSTDSCCGASFTTITNFDVAQADVPEPAMLGLFGLGFAGLGLARRRRA